MTNPAVHSHSLSLHTEGVSVMFSAVDRSVIMCSTDRTGRVATVSMARDEAIRLAVDILNLCTAK